MVRERQQERAVESGLHIVLQASFQHEELAGGQVGHLLRKAQQHVSTERVNRGRFVGALLRDASARLHHDEDNPNSVLAYQCARGMTLAPVGVFRSAFRTDCGKTKDGDFVRPFHQIRAPASEPRHT